MQSNATEPDASAGTTPREKPMGVWNYHPELPIGGSPLAQWPIRPFVVLKQVLGGWLPISQKLLIAGFATFTWFYLTPSPETTQTFAIDWIAFVFARNLVIFTLLAGGLHLYLYTAHRQGDAFRYDRRPFQSGVRFTFGTQLRDNIFWSLMGIPIWTAWEVVGLWAYSNHYLPRLAFSDHPIWFVLLFVVLAILGNLHFYWVHRLIHWQPLYKHVHSLHHRNIICGPWSGYSNHPVEHVLYLSNVLFLLVLASHPIHLLFSLQVKTLTAPTSHSGYDKLAPSADATDGAALGDFYHQLHHRYFECNYGEPELPFDHWFGTLHDGTEDATARIRQRMRDKGIKRT